VWTGKGREGSLSESPPVNPPGWIIRPADGKDLSTEIMGRRWSFGAVFDGNKYHPTLSHEKAVTGVYLPKGLEAYPSVAKAKKKAGKREPKTPTPTTEGQEQPTKEGAFKSILTNGAADCLNGVGRPMRAVATCTRTWRIFSQRPAHTSALAWAGEPHQPMHVPSVASRSCR